MKIIQYFKDYINDLKNLSSEGWHYFFFMLFFSIGAMAPIISLLTGIHPLMVSLDYIYTVNMILIYYAISAISTFIAFVIYHKYVEKELSIIAFGDPMEE